MSTYDLTSEKISFTFQRLIQTDGAGNYYDGIGNPVTLTGGIKFYFQTTPPSSPNVGDRWMHSDTGREYVFIDDTVSTQWVQPYS